MKYLLLCATMFVASSCKTLPEDSESKGFDRAKKVKVGADNDLLVKDQFDPEKRRPWIDLYPCKDPQDAAKYPGCPLQAGLRQKTFEIIGEMKKTKWGQSSRGSKIIGCFEKALRGTDNRLAAGEVNFHYMCEDTDGKSHMVPKEGVFPGNAEYLPGYLGAVRKATINMGIECRFVARKMEINNKKEFINACGCTFSKCELVGSIANEGLHACNGSSQRIGKSYPKDMYGTVSFEEEQDSTAAQNEISKEMGCELNNTVYQDKKGDTNPNYVPIK